MMPHYLASHWSLPPPRGHSVALRLEQDGDNQRLSVSSSHSQALGHHALLNARSMHLSVSPALKPWVGHFPGRTHSFQCKYHGLYTVNTVSFLESEVQNVFQIHQQGLVPYALEKYVCDIYFMKQCFII